MKHRAMEILIEQVKLLEELREYVALGEISQDETDGNIHKVIEGLYQVVSEACKNNPELYSV